MRAWTRVYKMLVTVVMVLSLCSHSFHVTADTDLEALEEVRDALSHADRSLTALSDLLNEVITEPPDTTIHVFSTSTTTTTTSTTITTPNPPPTTTTTAPTPPITVTTTTPTPTTTTTTPQTTTTTTPKTTTTTTTPKTTTTTTPKTTTTTTTSTKPPSGSSDTAEEFQEDFTIVDDGALVWNSYNFPRDRVAQDSHGQLPSGVFAPLLQAIALAKDSSDSEHLKKQKSSAEHVITEVPTERFKGLMRTFAPSPWWMRVNMQLSIMGNLIADIIGGSVDVSHATQLEEEASEMDELVEEGRNDTSLVTEEVDLKLLDTVQNDLYNATDLVNERIAEEKADRTEMVVTIVMLSLLFVMVLVGLIIAFVRPWAKRSGLKSSRNKWSAEAAVAEDGTRTFPDARFMQHSHINMDLYKSHDSKF